MTITPDDVEYLKTIFVSRETCDTKNDQQERDIIELKMSITSIQTKLNMLLGILGAIGVAVLSIAVKLMFG